MHRDLFGVLPRKHQRTSAEMILETAVEQGKWCVYFSARQGATRAEL